MYAFIFKYKKRIKLLLFKYEMCLRIILDTATFNCDVIFLLEVLVFLKYEHIRLDKDNNLREKTRLCSTISIKCMHIAPVNVFNKMRMIHSIYT